ncbi:MAG: hypothetical protein COB54_08615 [Alphaproteobacteria bacterium]|nr:MAG: hypothetical protein COB54_08615 [Alphaproteobacteria bacterium]
MWSVAHADGLGIKHPIDSSIAAKNLATRKQNRQVLFDYIEFFRIKKERMVSVIYCHRSNFNGAKMGV